MKNFTSIIGNECNMSAQAETIEKFTALLFTGVSIIIEANMLWINGRVKGVTLPDGTIVHYGEYEREYFTEDQLNSFVNLKIEEAEEVAAGPEPTATKETTPLGHLYDTCYRAYCGTSFSPEKRAVNTIAEFERALAEDLTKVPDNYKEKYTAKFIALFVKWMGAKSRCISSMITGPARFPVARAQKFNNWEDNHYKEFAAWRTRILAALARSEKKRTQGSELEQAEHNLKQRLINQEAMKTANSIIRKHKGNETALPELLEKTGWNEKTCRDILQPDYMGRKGFAQFNLTNNLANIKRLEQRVKELQHKATIAQQQQENGIKETNINGAIIKSDFADDRLKIEFDGKPAQNVITALKGSGFRWSPFLKCWCRKLTRQAQFDAMRICKEELKVA